MQAQPQRVSPAPELPRATLASPAVSRSIPETADHDHSSPEPYWPRLARALVLMFFAVALHLWGVQSPHPQEPVYSSLAARLLAPVLVSPPLPLAPPFRFITDRTAPRDGRRVTIRTTILNIPVMPGPPPPTRAATVDRRLVPVGTSGTSLVRVASATPYFSRFSQPVASSPVVEEAAPAPAVVEYRPAPTPPAPAPMAVALREPRVEPTTPSASRVPVSSDRAALPADRTETDARGEEQRRQKEVVLAVLNEYTRALERRDLRATKAVYPSANSRRLQQSFSDVQAQQFRIASCDVKFSPPGHDANARCVGNSTFHPKVGSTIRYTDREWVFSLARDGGAWQIREARFQ
jgi:hypothetical protein